MQTVHRETVETLTLVDCGKAPGAKVCETGVSSEEAGGPGPIGAAAVDPAEDARRTPQGKPIAQVLGPPAGPGAVQQGHDGNGPNSAVLLAQGNDTAEPEQTGKDPVLVERIEEVGQALKDLWG